MSEKPSFYRRQFLNDEEHGGHAFIEARISPVDVSYKSFEANLSVADCNRVVDLDFSVWGKESLANMRQKICNLRRAIVAFEAVLLTQIDELDALPETKSK